MAQITFRLVDGQRLMAVEVLPYHNLTSENCMENSIILIIDFFSRNSTVGEKEWKNSKKKKFRCWWVERWPKEEIWLLHTHFIQMKNEGSSFPLYYISCLEFCRLAQQQANWEKMKVGLTFYCLFVHGYSFSATASKPYYYSKSSYLLKKTDDEKELPSFDALLHLFHPFSPQLPSVPIGLFAPRGMKIPSYCFLTYAHQIIFLFRKWWSSILTS